MSLREIDLEDLDRVDGAGKCCSAAPESDSGFAEMFKMFFMNLLFDPTDGLLVVRRRRR